jgi:DNA-directed RNA polymerase specialized sigma24 family protein
MDNALDRVERLLALILLQNAKGATQQEKAVLLNLGQFSNVEIADILGIRSQVVAQHLYASRKSKASKHK